VNQGNPSHTGNGGVSEDGVAIFWNTSRLKFIEQTEEAYNILHKDFPTKKNNAKQRVLFVTLYDTVKKQNVLVVSGHFKSGNTEGDKKDKRVMVQEFAKKLKEKGRSVDGVIFACDFNASRESGAFKLFHDGKCDQEEKLQIFIKGTWQDYSQMIKSMELPPKKDISANLPKLVNPTITTEGEASKPTTVTVLSSVQEVHGKKYRLVQSIKEFTLGHEEHAAEYLESAYTSEYSGKKGDKNGRHSAVKQRKAGDQPSKIGPIDQHTIDFIFTDFNLEADAILSIPKFKEVEKQTNGMYLPHWKYPSDHFMIGADLVWAEEE